MDSDWIPIIHHSLAGYINSSWNQNVWLIWPVPMGRFPLACEALISVMLWFKLFMFLKYCMHATSWNYQINWYNTFSFGSIIMSYICNVNFQTSGRIISLNSYFSSREHFGIRWWNFILLTLTTILITLR